MLEDLYKVLLEKINGGNQCVMLTCFELNSSRNGTITEKILLTSDEIENKTFPLHEDIYQEIKLSLKTGNIGIINLQKKYLF